MPAVEKALEKTFDLRPARRELLVLPETLFGQRERLGRHDRRDGDLDPLLAGPINGGRPLRHPAPLEPHGPGDPLAGRVFCLSEAGGAPVGRILEDPPHRTPLPAFSGLSRRDSLRVQPGRDLSDGQAFPRIERVDLSHHRRLRLEDLVVSRPFLRFLDVPEPVGSAAQHAGLSLLGPMALAPPGPLQDLRPLVFRQHPLHLQKKPFLRRLGLGARTKTVSTPFLASSSMSRT